MLDLNRTLQLVKGALFDAEETWQAYLPEADNWQKTAFLLTGPLIIASAILAYLIGLFGSDAAILGQFRPTIASTLMTIVMGFVAAGVVAFIFSALAGAFGGKGKFALGLAATTLAFVPGYLGQALAQLPWIGALVGLGLAIYGLILLWRIIPVYLEVPDSKRAVHYILSLVATIAVMVVLSILLRPIIGPDTPDFGSVTSSDTAAGGAGGLFGGAIRQAELVATAEEDRYEPPSDGKLEDDQVESFIRVMSRAEEMLQEKAERMRELGERADREEQMSMREMSEMMSGATEMMGMNTIEIEIVKSGGGNWAEHQWVKESLRTAYIQKDINDAVKHNYELFMDYEDELRSFVTR